MIPLELLKANWRIAAALGVILAAFLAGWTINGWRYDSRLKTEAEKNIALMGKYQDEQKNAAKRAQETEQKTRIVYRTIKEGIPNVTDHRICFADSHALSLWNRALQGMPTTAAGATQAPGGTAATDAEVLTNAVENFEQYKQVRDQLNALIDWIEAHR